MIMENLQVVLLTEEELNLIDGGTFGQFMQILSVCSLIVGPLIGLPLALGIYNGYQSV